jgi:hypothetical protein
MTTFAKVSQLAREVLHSGPGTLRVSGLAREVLHSGPGTVRVAALVREVLRSSSLLTMDTGMRVSAMGGPRRDDRMLLSWRSSVFALDTPINLSIGKTLIAGDTVFNLSLTLATTAADDGFVYLIC